MEPPNTVMNTMDMNRSNQSESQSQENLAVLWSKVYPMVSAYVHSLLVSFHDAEDVIQDVAVTMAKQFDRYDPSRDPVPWVLGIAHHKAVDHLRAMNRTNALFEEQTRRYVTQAYQDIRPEIDEMRSVLDGCLAQLRERSRYVLRFRYLSDMSIADIGRKVGLSCNAVYVMLHRSRAALARCIEKKTRIEWQS